MFKQVKIFAFFIENVVFTGHKNEIALSAIKMKAGKYINNT